MILTRLASFVLVIALAGCGGKDDKLPEPAKSPSPPVPAPKAESPPKTETPPTPQSKAEHVLTAAAFNESIKKDKKAAASKFKGKLIEITGTVRTRGDESGRGFELLLEDNLAFYFLKENVAAKVLPGQAVRILGVFDKSGVDGSFEECELLDAKPYEPVRLTADELGAQVKADSDAAVAKLKGKGLVMTGAVKSKDPRGDLRLLLTLANKDGVKIVADFTTISAGKLNEKLKTGDTVKLSARLVDSQPNKGELYLEDCRIQE